MLAIYYRSYLETMENMLTNGPNGTNNGTSRTIF